MPDGLDILNLPPELEAQLRRPIESDERDGKKIKAFLPDPRLYRIFSNPNHARPDVQLNRRLQPGETPDPVTREKLPAVIVDGEETIIVFDGREYDEEAAIREFLLTIDLDELELPDDE